jgi:DNA segregation ATPase FtsK/SpoIIIE-like protein
MIFGQKHPLEKRAETIADNIRGKLTRMGMCHRVKYREFDELFQVEFSQVEASPSLVRLRINVDTLPKLVTTARLKSDEVLNDLGHTLGHLVTFEDHDKKQGCWFIVHLDERGGIPSYVPFRQMIRSYPDNPSPLMVPLGYGRHGPMWQDLRDMPHLLVAGATKKGKSVLIHALLGSILCMPPDRLKLFFADLKGGMTLGKYKRIPHMSNKHYVKSADGLPPLLLLLQEEMERRANAMEHVAEDIDEWKSRS